VIFGGLFNLILPKVGVTADLESFNAHDMQSERDNNNFTENKGLSGTQVTHLRQSGISSNGKLKRKRGKDASRLRMLRSSISVIFFNNIFL
jgi:hypothetical protein